ncbi:Hypothetical predicted protein [Olea europaea subsp. europaea]|uniref:Uncharacterized protein n=1 Tax=Olea europaea subsp. europaea TaxID=158383 RepID=A0A8S0UL58_OLEEU|nr:Hypothetical predicted protein [Olea europaea subsp. europaea]
MKQKTLRYKSGRPQSTALPFIDKPQKNFTKDLESHQLNFALKSSNSSSFSSSLKYGVAGMQSVEGRAPAVEGSLAVPEVGQAVQARPRRSEAQFEEGLGFLLGRSGAWVHDGK